MKYWERNSPDKPLKVGGKSFKPYKDKPKSVSCNLCGNNGYFLATKDDQLYVFKCECEWGSYLNYQFPYYNTQLHHYNKLYHVSDKPIEIPRKDLRLAVKRFPSLKERILWAFDQGLIKAI